jgi:DNA-binding transcriptional LysR family regulator
LKQLEAELGLRLFARTTKGIAATEESRLLYTEVERAYFGMQNTASFAASLSHRRQGRIVVSTAWLSRGSPPWSLDFPKLTPTFRSRFIREVQPTLPVSSAAVRSTSESLSFAARNTISPVPSRSISRG